MVVGERQWAWVGGAEGKRAAERRVEGGQIDAVRVRTGGDSLGPEPCTNVME